MDQATREDIRHRMVFIAETCTPAEGGLFGSLPDDILRACLTDNELAVLASELTHQAAASTPTKESVAQLIPLLRDSFTQILQSRFKDDQAGLIQEKQLAADAAKKLERYALSLGQLATSAQELADDPLEARVVAIRELVAEMLEHGAVHKLVGNLEEALAHIRILQSRVDAFKCER